MKRRNFIVTTLAGIGVLATAKYLPKEVEASPTKRVHKIQQRWFSKRTQLIANTDNINTGMYLRDPELNIIFVVTAIAKKFGVSVIEFMPLNYQLYSYRQLGYDFNRRKYQIVGIRYVSNKGEASPNKARRTIKKGGNNAKHRSS